MKLYLIIVLILKIVNSVLASSENTSLKNIGKNLFHFPGSNNSTDVKLYKTNYEDKSNYFCSICIKNNLCQQKEKCYMCTKYCKHLKNVKKSSNFKISTNINSLPDKGTEFTINNTHHSEIIANSKLKNNVYNTLFLYIMKALLRSVQTDYIKSKLFNKIDLNDLSDSLQAEENIISNNLIQENYNNDVSISSMSLKRNKRDSDTITNNHQTNSQIDNKQRTMSLIKKRNPLENHPSNTSEKISKVSTSRERLFKPNLSDTNRSIKLLPFGINKDEANRNKSLLLKSSIPADKTETEEEPILQMKQPVNQVPHITTRNLVDAMDDDKNGINIKSETEEMNSESSESDDILTTPFLGNDEANNEKSSLDDSTLAMLKNLEKKIENVADLIRESCRYGNVLKSENPNYLDKLRIPMGKTKIHGITQKILDNLSKSQANLLPNKIIETPYPQLENLNQNDVQTNDKILRDINPELLSENADQTSDPSQNLSQNENQRNDEENNQSIADENKKNLPTPITFRDQFRLRKNPFQNDPKKPSIIDIIKQRTSNIPNLINRFANMNEDEQVTGNSQNFDGENSNEDQDELYEPVPWSNANKRKPKSDAIPKPKLLLPKVKDLFAKNNLKDKFKNNLFPAKSRENFRNNLPHLNNFISKLNDLPNQQLPKINPLRNRIVSPDMPNIPFNNLDSEKPSRKLFQRIHPINRNYVDNDEDNNPDYNEASLPPSEDNSFTSPNQPMINQRFGEENDFEPSAPNDALGSSLKDPIQNPNTLLGHVVIPQNHEENKLKSLDDIEKKKIFFEGTGVNLPITIKKNSEGSYKVSLAVDNICNACPEKPCDAKEDLLGVSPVQEQQNSFNKVKLVEQNFNQNKEDSIAQEEVNSNSNKNSKMQTSAVEDIPQMKPRFFDQGLLNRRRNNGIDLKAKQQTLFPRLSQLAKRSPNLLITSPSLKLEENYFDDGYSDDFNSLNRINEDISESNFKTKSSVPETDKPVKKNTIHKRVAIMKDMINWIKNVAKENTV